MYNEEFTKLQELIAEIERHDVNLTGPTQKAIDDLKEAFNNNVASEEVFLKSLELLRALDEGGKAQRREAEPTKKMDEKEAIRDFECRYEKAMKDPRAAIQDFITSVSVLARIQSSETRQYIAANLRERISEDAADKIREEAGDKPGTAAVVKQVQLLDKMVSKMTDALEELWDEFYDSQTT